MILKKLSKNISKAPFAECLKNVSATCTFVLATRALVRTCSEQAFGVGVIKNERFRLFFQ